MHGSVWFKSRGYEEDGCKGAYMAKIEQLRSQKSRAGAVEFKVGSPLQTAAVMMAAAQQDVESTIGPGRLPLSQVGNIQTIWNLKEEGVLLRQGIANRRARIERRCDMFIAAIRKHGRIIIKSIQEAA